MTADASSLLFILLWTLGVLAISGVAAALAGRWSERTSVVLGMAGTGVGCLAGLAAAIAGLTARATGTVMLPWHMPTGSFSIGLDPLSAFFLIPLFLLSGLAAVFALGYFRPWNGRNPGRFWLFYNFLVASMALVVLARNGVLFLVAWEAMSLASFFLVVFDDRAADARDAGWVYLVATHIGTAFLIVLFILMGRAGGSQDFAAYAAPVGSAGILFLLALVGFGTKAGFVPLHVWLPEAHPAAPGPVSAVMSGVMIKMGIYGLLRMLTFLGLPAAWWGWTLVAVGLTSGIPGVLFALAQHDLKRLLAYHSVENIGIIALGLGLGLLGVSCHLPALAVLGFAGGLLHVLNHAVFKGLLFLGAGAVAHATGTRDMEQLGGLLKKMPWTGTTFLIGAIAIAGLPPLNGFVSEFLIYLAALTGAGGDPRGIVVAAMAVIAGLALIGGLAAACFAKAFGIVFQGEGRSARVAPAHDPGVGMRWPMAILAAGCVLLGVLAPAALPYLGRVLQTLTNLSPGSVAEPLSSAAHWLSWVVLASGVFFAVLVILTVARRLLLARRVVAEAETWDCGYLRPTARMQYTASSFAQPLIRLFRPLLRTRVEAKMPQGLFPREAALHTETGDVFVDRLFAPFFSGLTSWFSKLRLIQQGRLQLYVLYIALTLLVLLIWQL